MHNVVLKRIDIKGQRFYEIPGKNKKYPSITTVLSNVIAKPYLYEWQLKVSLDQFKSRIIKNAFHVNTEEHGELKCIPDEAVLKKLLQDSSNYPEIIRKDSAQFGTESHILFERIINENLDDIECPPELIYVKESFLKWKKWSDKKNITVLGTEITVYSDTYEYAGTIDAVAKMNRGGEDILVIFDWKTSNSINNEHALQVSAYAKAYEELYGKKIMEGIVVRLDKTSSSFQMKRVRDLDETFKGFVSARYLYDIMNTSLF